MPNRLQFLDRVNLSIREAQRTGSQFAVLFLDLDNFKLINDSMGHEAGDQLLLALAEKILCGVRATDTVAYSPADLSVAHLGGTNSRS